MIVGARGRDVVQADRSPRRTPQSPTSPGSCIGLLVVAQIGHLVIEQALLVHRQTRRVASSRESIRIIV